MGQGHSWMYRECRSRDPSCTSTEPLASLVARSYGHKRHAGARVSDVTGFFYPRTATGRSSLLPAPPWHYSGDLLTVEYRTAPDRVAELLPGPLAPARDDPGAVALIW